MTEKTYTVQEAIPMMNMTKQCINRAIIEGRLLATRNRDRAPWRISQRAIDEYLKNRRVNPKG
jgi:excisionase family DNA binding protein